MRAASGHMGLACYAMQTGEVITKKMLPSTDARRLNESKGRHPVDALPTPRHERVRVLHDKGAGQGVQDGFKVGLRMHNVACRESATGRMQESTHL
jgi:hypothetical protein